MATIKSYLTPPRLYRYRSQKHFEREIEAIEEGYLFCAAYLYLNDPMEGLFTTSKLFRKTQDHRTTRDAIIDRKSRIGICSFSEVYDHELLWAHYADQFKGICVAYNLSRLLKNLGDEFTFVRMYYDEMVPTLRGTRKTPGELARMVLSCKNYRWLYEREWRMFAKVGKAYYSDTACVRRVYLGSRIDPDHRRRITSVLKRLKIKTSDMVIDEYFISFTAKPRS